MRAILIFFHVPSNTGFAIRSYERSFLQMAVRLVGDPSSVHLAYTDLSSGPPQDLPFEVGSVIRFDPMASDPTTQRNLAEHIRAHGIDFAFGIDQPPSRGCFRTMREAGVRHIVSYWGAPISSINRGWKLLAKRLQFRTLRYAPDHFVFESHAMARTATHGRGIPAGRTSVVYLGVDPEDYPSTSRDRGLLPRDFSIPSTRRTIVYSGHMEERKGVHVLIRAAIELVDTRARTDFHLLVLGNRPGEETRFVEALEGHQAREHVTFGGYRKDIPQILPNCYAGAIASTGWDSFTVSSLEMASAGLPLLVSDLQGLSETVEEGATGYTFPPGDHIALAERIEYLLDHPDHRARMSDAARRRILDGFTERQQVDRLVSVCRSVASA